MDIREKNCYDDTQHSNTELLKQSFCLLKEGIIITNAEGNIVFVNCIAQELFRYKDKPELAVNINFNEWLETEGGSTFHFQAMQRVLSGDIALAQHSYLNFYTHCSLDLTFFGLKDENDSIKHVCIEVKDSTEQRRLQRKAHTLLESIEGIIWEADPVSFQISYVNQQAEKILGYPLEAWLQPGFWQKHIHPEDVDAALEYCAVATKNSLSHTIEFRMIANNGNIIWFRDITSVIVENGKVTALRGMMIDITKEKTALQKLAEKEELFRAIVQNSFDAIALIDEKMDIKYISPSIYSILGYTDKELINTHSHNIIEQSDRPVASRRLEDLLNNKILHAANLCFVHKNGHHILIETLGRNMMDNPFIKGVLISLRDITEKKRLELELIQKEVQQQKEITQAILKTQEREREFIAKELHDNINQLISAAKLMLDTAKEDATNRDVLLSNGSETLKKAIDGIRNITSSLVIYDIQDLGLCESLRKLVDNVNLTSTIRATANINQNIDKKLNVEAKTHLYRIIQEQITNVLKHSQASTMYIELSTQRKNTTLLVKDDGVGFIKSRRRNGIGLKNIANRVQALEGSFSIDTSPSGGCLMKVTF